MKWFSILFLVLFISTANTANADESNMYIYDGGTFEYNGSMFIYNNSNAGHNLTMPPQRASVSQSPSAPNVTIIDNIQSNSLYSKKGNSEERDIILHLTYDGFIDYESGKEFKVVKKKIIDTETGHECELVERGIVDTQTGKFYPVVEMKPDKPKRLINELYRKTLIHGSTKSAAYKKMMKVARKLGLAPGMKAGYADPETGLYYPYVGGGLANPVTGDFYPETGPGQYVIPQTGRTIHTPQ